MAAARYALPDERVSRGDSHLLCSRVESREGKAAGVPPAPVLNDIGSASVLQAFLVGFLQGCFQSVFQVTSIEFRIIFIFRTGKGSGCNITHFHCKAILCFVCFLFIYVSTDLDTNVRDMNKM